MTLIKRSFFSLLVFAAAGPLREARAQNTDGTVTYTVKTQNYSAKYAPKHVSAVWLVDGNNKFVKTLCRHAGSRINYLSKWNADRGSNKTVDGVTSATVASQPQTHTVKWNCRGADGQVAADGRYTFRAEYTSSNGQGPYLGSLCQFVKGTTAVTTNFPDYSNGGGQFTSLSLTYTPYNEIAVTGLAPNSAVADTTVAIAVAVTNQTLNSLSFTVAVSNLTSGTLIGTLPVTGLPGRAAASLTFNWNTAGLPATAYQIRAVASKLATETNTVNNVLTGSITLSSATAGDIAVTGLTPSDGAANSSVPVRVAVTNKMASATGPFTVSLAAPIAAQQVTSLAAFAGTNLTFAWNTAGLKAGVYPISAQAGPLAAETYTADNTLTQDLTLRDVAHDLAISAVAVAPLVPPNVTTNVTVVVTNKGDASEAFTATLRDVTSAPLTIGTRAVTRLPAGAATNLVFAWNTATNAAFWAGYHTLQAQVAPVAGEVALSNNTHTAQVIVTPGLATQTLVAADSTWKYLDHGLDLSKAPWQTPDYDDGLWASGAAPLGYGLANVATVLESGPDPARRRTTFYFRREFTVDVAPLSVTGRLMRAHGAILCLNGVEVARHNMPDGDAGYDTLASGAAAGADATNLFGFALAPGQLAAGRNLLTAELHLSSGADTTAGFALELSGVAPIIPPQPRVAPVAIEPDGSVQSGDPLVVFVELANTGNVSTDCLVLLRDAASGDVLAAQAAGLLAPGESTIARLTWPTFGAATGARTLQAVTVINGATNLANVASVPVTLAAPDFSPRKVAAEGSLGGRCSAVAVSGRHVYLGCGATLEVWDAGTPAAPVRVGALRLPGIVEDLAATNNWVFAAAGPAGVQIIDASSPTQLLHRATFDTTGHARRLALAGSQLYVADVLGGVRVLDVSAPASPTLSGAYQTTGPAQAVTYAPPHLLVLDSQRGLQSLSAAAPDTLAVSGTLRQLTAGLSLAAVPGAALVADANGALYRVDLTAPAAPAVATNTLLPAAGRGLACAGPALYVAAGPQGLLTLDASTLALHSATAVGDEAYDVAVAGNILYVAAGFAGCRALDISAPLAPAPLAVYATGARAVDAAAAGSTLWVAADEGGLQAHSLQNPALPALLGSVSSASNSRCVEVSYPLAYVGDGLFGLKIFNITNAESPQLVGSHPATGLSHIRRIALSGTRLVLTDGRSLQLLSVANPAAPSLLATVANAPGSFVFDLAAVGDQAYAACGSAGLRIYGLNSQLALSGTYATPGPATGLASASNLLHVTCGPYGWQTLSLAANPVRPVLVKTSATGAAFGAAASGSLLFLTDGRRGGHVLNVYSPLAPLSVTNFLNLTQALRLRAAGGLMLAAEDEAGLAIFYPRWLPSTPAERSATAGAAFEMALPESFASAVKVTVKGLPPGVRYNGTTRLITGVPTKAGVFAVTLSAAGVPTQTVTVTIEALPAWAWGTFSGLIEGGGIASMSVTSLGRVSGKLTCGGTNYSFSAASYAAGGNAAAGFDIVAVAKAGRVVLPLTLRVGHPADSAPATLGVSEGLLGNGLRWVAYRNVWKEAGAELAPYIGYYTATLPGSSAFGSGYLTFTVDKSGRVKTAGKLADGTAVSLSGALLLDGYGGVFMTVYTAPVTYRGGCLFGLAEFVKPEGQAVILRPLGDVPFLWQSRNPLATAVYGEGFLREPALSGGWYDKLGNLAAYYQNKDLAAGTDEHAPAPELTVGSAREPAAWWNPDLTALAPILNKQGLMTGLSVVTDNSDDDDEEEDDEEEEDDDDEPEAKPIDLKITLTRATGVFKGSFKVWFNVAERMTAKSALYEGVLTPERENKADGIAGRGFFVWPDKSSYTTLPGKVTPYGFKGSYDFLMWEE